MLAGKIANAKRVDHIKKVRMSLDTKVISPPNEKERTTSWRYSIGSTSSQFPRKSRVNKEEETLSEMLRNIDSRRNSVSSSGSSRKSFTTIPKFVLSNINDEKLLLNHSLHRIDIEVINLAFCEDSSLLTNEKFKYLYVEYSFMMYKGHLLETQALSKPQNSNESIFYHFNNTFEIRPAEDKKRFKVLKSMLEKNSKNHLKFFIVSEPLEKQNDEECEEVG